MGYTLYTDLKVSEVTALFQVDPISLLTANSIDISLPDIDNWILPSGLFLKVPTLCSCFDSIRRSLSTRYKTRPTNTLASIADQIRLLRPDPRGQFHLRSCRCVRSRTRVSLVGVTMVRLWRATTDSRVGRRRALWRRLARWVKWGWRRRATSTVELLQELELLIAGGGEEAEAWISDGNANAEESYIIRKLPLYPSIERNG